MEPKSNDKPAEGKGQGYGKRPVWQWILIYLVIGGLLYWLVYYFMTTESADVSLY